MPLNSLIKDKIKLPNPVKPLYVCWDLSYESSDVRHTEIKMMSSENLFFYLSYKVLSIVLLIIVSAQ